MGAASTKEFNVKIRSLLSTRKITKTMKMVSASKLRKAHAAQANARLYAQNLTGLISRITHGVTQDSHPLLTLRENVRNVVILIITSDKGLCGAFNHNANKQVASWIKENRDHKRIHLCCCGKRGYLFFRKHDIVKTHYEGVTADPQFSAAEKIGNDLSRSFLNGESDEVYLTYNQFFSPLSQKTVFEKILPIDPRALLKTATLERTDYIFDPETKELLAFLIPRFLYFKIYFALLENAAGEHGARMTVMDNATKNASELIDQYTMYRNRARQAAITTELSEIVAGADALN
jgi:F-type H+-transporting ATPase subunit gamma